MSEAFDDKIKAELDRRWRDPASSPDLTDSVEASAYDAGFADGARWAAADMHQRELHHFEVEKAVTEALEFQDATDHDGWWHVTEIRRILRAAIA